VLATVEKTTPTGRVSYGDIFKGYVLAFDKAHKLTGTHNFLVLTISHSVTPGIFAVEIGLVALLKKGFAVAVYLAQARY
jgi:hypothetical protein